MSDEKEIIETLKNLAVDKYIDEIKLEEKDVEAILNIIVLYTQEKEKNKNAYRKANNYLYFNDSADYEVALWEVIRTLRPDLADKWDNGEDAVLEYIEEE